ncbi:DUF58 domain-containing protein [Thermococcus paralvinellae]|uniref:DUF58 domain-containing protein n=1 Tax=Thermococcus paralvinellae TaxID=582419 RepID=W0I4N3_9EURY|nr:DUF58 domain-containing protein [Thermococcus paralvinellae]AHF79405.1 hypothetical protein containing DUF58 domain [Thermococcus paralvinellae]
MNREDVLWTLAGLSFLHGYLASNVFSAIFGLGISAYIIYSQRRFNPKVEVSRIYERSLEEGKRCRVVLKVKNLGSALKVKVKEEAPKEVKVKIPDEVVLKPGEEKSIEYSVIPEKKGEYELLTKIYVYDLSELYFEEIVLGKYKIEVLPSVDSIREAAKEDYNFKISEVYKKSILLGLESMELYGLREYLPGDDLRRIDWKASSRLGKLIVKEFLKEREGDVYIVLDATREMRKGIKRAKIDYASTLALHLATLLLKKNYRVGMIIYWDDRFKVIKPSRGREQLNKIRNAIRFKPEKGLLSLKGSITVKFSEKGRKFLDKLFPRKRRSVAEALLNIKSPSYLILITDLMSNTSQLYRLMLMIRKKHKGIILSPNPILFYSDKLDEETLKFLYEKYLEREKTVKKFNSVIPTIDLGPSDYLREIVRRMEK